ncbi:MAG: hypothetical protein ACK4Q5_00805 [Saprospiraceae bacterium]
MDNALQFLTDSTGKRTSVLIPIADWEKMDAERRQLQKKLEVLLSIREGIREVRDARKNGIELQSLDDFLNEQ